MSADPAPAVEPVQQLFSFLDLEAQFTAIREEVRYPD
jgi:hypothetical protein